MKRFALAVMLLVISSSALAEVSVSIIPPSPPPMNVFYIATGLQNRTDAIVFQLQRPNSWIAPTSWSDYPYVAVEAIEAGFVMQPPPFMVDIVPPGGCIPNDRPLVSLPNGKVASINRVY